jgi:hypothetical protein
LAVFAAGAAADAAAASASSAVGTRSLQGRRCHSPVEQRAGDCCPVWRGHLLLP